MPIIQRDSLNADFTIIVNFISDHPVLQSISAGGYHAFYGTSDLISWGFNAFGQLGKGITEHVSTPEGTLIHMGPDDFYGKITFDRHIAVKRLKEKLGRSLS